MSDLDTVVAVVVERVCVLQPEVPRQRVEDAARTVASRYADARVQAYLPILIERGVREQLAT